MSRKVIYVKYHNATMPRLMALDTGDWIDVRAAETVEMKAGEYKKISLGISMRLPEGYEAHLAPRSSTFEKFGVLQVNGVGVIDNSYSGDSDIWMFPALAMRDTVIHEGDRICQFRIMKRMNHVHLQNVMTLWGEARGGFGSTGVD